MRVFSRLFPNAIGSSLRKFLFGERCQLCDDGSRRRRWSRYDGTGSWRMHTVHTGEGYDPINDYDSAFCQRNGWFSRHWVATALIVFVLAAISCAVLSDRAGAAEQIPCWKAKALLVWAGGKKSEAQRLAEDAGYTKAQIAEVKRRCDL